MFDLLRKHGPEEVDNYHIEVAGNGAWKNLVVSTLDTGEVIVDNDKILDKYRSLIESGEIQSYKNPIEAEKDRVIMYKEIIGVE